MDAIVKLRKKIGAEGFAQRAQIERTHRYHTVRHEMKVVDPILTGKYLEAPSRSNPPKELVASGIPLPALEMIKKEQAVEVES